MKRLVNKGIFVLLFLCTAACGDEFLDVNVDPNNPNDAPVELVFPAAVASTASVVGGDYAILGGIWSQYYTQNNGSNQYKTVDAFDLQAASFAGRWQELYAGALNDLKFVKTKASANEDWNSYLMATVMEAYTYQVLVDLYDQIPFDNSLQGSEGVFQPTYQSGQEVYDGLITRLNEALGKSISANASATVASGDVVFGGNMNQWVRFANTLKLKIYLRQIYARPQVAEAGIRALYTAGANFLTTDANLDIFVDATSKRNPLFEQDQSAALNTNQNLRASGTLFSFLQINNDPRLAANYLPGSGGQKAMAQGSFETLSTQLAPTSVSRALIKATDPVYFISKAESYFLQAEAVLRGLGTGNAQALYESGIRASFEQLGLADPADLISGAYAYPAGGSFEQRLEAIIVQKWVALAGSKQGIEAFFERNRTNYPQTSTESYWQTGTVTPNAAYIPGRFTYPLEGVTSGTFAKRLIFPDTERTRNPNTPAQEPLTKEVWWDVH